MYSGELANKPVLIILLEKYEKVRILVIEL